MVSHFIAIFPQHTLVHQIEDVELIERVICNKGFVILKSFTIHLKKISNKVFFVEDHCKWVIIFGMRAQIFFVYFSFISGSLGGARESWILQGVGVSFHLVLLKQGVGASFQELELPNKSRTLSLE